MRYMRFCGRIAIAIKLNEERGARGVYQCHITWTENAGTRWERRASRRIAVQPAPCDTDLRSDAQIDSIAHAALSFADDERAGFESHADYTDSGWHIGRPFAVSQ